MKNKEYLDNFENKLTDELLNLCTSYKMLDGTILSTEETDKQWEKHAPEYIADAIKEIKEYPTVSVAWATYIGMAVAYYWDKDWNQYCNLQYKSFYGKKGFDDMDEHIMQNILKIEPESGKYITTEEMVRRCAQKTVNIIRHEQIEPQSPIAFYVFTRAIKTMYRIGVAIEFKRLGYKLEKIKIPATHC